MKTAIIILNYNDYETTIKMINQIKNYKVLNYIIIVDNNSSDDSYDILKKYEEGNIEIIKTNQNKGYAYGNNYGIKYVNEKYKIDNIIISNPDIIVSEDTIKMLVKDLNDNDISLISPIINQHGQILRGWKIPTYKDELLSNINYVQRFAKKKMLYSDEHYKSDLSKVEVVSGCFFIIKNNDFKKINYFDENTFLYYEENIIGYKLKDINKNVYVDNKVSIIHDESVSVNKSVNSIKKYKILKNSQRYYVKNYLKTNIFGRIFLRFIYYISLLVAYIVYFISKLGGKK